MDDTMENMLRKRRRDLFDDPLVGTSGRRRLMTEDDLSTDLRGGHHVRFDELGGVDGFLMDYGPFDDDGLAPRGRRYKELDESIFDGRRGGRTGGFDEDLFGFHEQPFHYMDTSRSAMMGDATLYDELEAYHRGPFPAPAYGEDILAGLDLDHSQRTRPLAMDRGMDVFASGSRGTFAEDLSRIWDAEYIDDEDYNEDAPWNLMESIEYEPMDSRNYGDDPMAIFRSAVNDPPRRRASSPSLTSGYTLPAGANADASFPRYRRTPGHRMGNPQADMLLGTRPLRGREETPMPDVMGPPPRRYRELRPRI